MFNKESQFINIIKHGTQLKINYKKLKNYDILSSNSASFLLHDNVLTKDIIFKLNTLKEDVLQTYTSTLILSQNERIVKKTFAFDKEEYVSAKLNNTYMLLMKKNKLFELEHYFKKVGFDYIFSPYQILNLHNEQNPSKNSLSVFLINSYAYILIVNDKNEIIFNKIIKISSFDDIKNSKFYENEVLGQKLYDEIYYLELTNLIKDAIKEYYSKKNVSFLEKVSILYTQKQVDNNAINDFKNEILLDINYHSISIDDSLYELNHEKDVSSKSYVKIIKKSQNFFKPFVLSSLLFIIIALAFIYYDRQKETTANKLIVEQKTYLSNKIILPNHIIKNRRIQKNLLNHFDMIPYNVLLKEANFESMKSTFLVDVLENETYIKVMSPRLLQVYKRSNVKYMNTDALVKEALIVNEDKIFKKSLIKAKLANYISDDFLPLKRVSEQIKNIFPKDAQIKYLSTFNSNISTFNYEITIEVKDPLEFFDLIDSLNEELYSINITYPISIKVDESENLTVKFLLQFHQNN